MVYKERFIAVVKVNGSILRERGESRDEVYIPFGSEYSLLLKNKESRKAQVQVQIDGVDVLGGNSLVLEPFQEMELERFLDSCNMSQGNKFKFIQKTQQIVEHRGDKIDDGFITVIFQFEAEKPEKKIVEEHHHHTYHDHYPWRVYPTYYSSNPVFTSGLTRGSCTGENLGGVFSSNISSNISDSIQVNSCNFADIKQAPIIDQDEGITVKGSISNQQFRYAYIGRLEENSHTINIRLKGTKSNGVVVDQPITVKTKLECKTCGKKSNSNEKFCSNCGTFLN